MTRYLIDADVAIFATTGQVPVLRDRFALCEPGEAALSAVTYAEIVLGMEQGRPPTPQALASFVEAVPILPFDDGAALHYGKLPFKRARFDRLLAAQALSIGATVVTNNETDFADVPGLTVENWTI